jgi:hypothetical protein
MAEAANRFIRPIQVQPVSQFADNSLAFNELASTLDTRQLRTDKGVENLGKISGLVAALDYDPLTSSESANKVQAKYRDKINEILDSGDDLGTTSASRQIIALQNEFMNDREVRTLSANKKAVEDARAFELENPGSYIPNKEQVLGVDTLDEQGNIVAKQFGPGVIKNQDVKKYIDDNFGAVRTNLQREVGQMEGITMDDISFQSQLLPDGRTKVVMLKKGKPVHESNLLAIQAQADAMVQTLADPNTSNLVGKFAQKTMETDDILNLISTSANAFRIDKEDITGNAATLVPDAKGKKKSKSVSKDDGTQLVISKTKSFNVGRTYTSSHVTETEDGVSKLPHSNYETFNTQYKDNYAALKDTPANSIEESLGTTLDAELKSNINNTLANMFKFDEETGEELLEFPEFSDDLTDPDDEFSKLYRQLRQALPSLPESAISKSLLDLSNKFNNANSEVHIDNTITHNAEAQMETDLSDTELAVYDPDSYPDRTFKVSQDALYDVITNDIYSEQVDNEFVAKSTTYPVLESMVVKTPKGTVNAAELLRDVRNADLSTAGPISKETYIEAWAPESPEVAFEADGTPKTKEKILADNAVLRVLQEKYGFNDLSEAYDAILAGSTGSGVAGASVNNPGEIFTDALLTDYNQSQGGRNKKELLDKESEIKQSLYKEHIEDKKLFTMTGFTTNPNLQTSANLNKNTMAFIEASLGERVAPGEKVLTEKGISYHTVNPNFRTDLAGMTLPDGTKLSELNGGKEYKKWTKVMDPSKPITDYSNTAVGIKQGGLIIDGNGQVKGHGMLVNSAGQPLSYKDEKTGEKRYAEIFYDAPPGDKTLTQQIYELSGATGNNFNLMQVIDNLTDAGIDPNNTNKSQIVTKALIPGQDVKVNRFKTKNGTHYKVNYSLPESTVNRIVEELQEIPSYANLVRTAEDAEKVLGTSFSLDKNFNNLHDVANSFKNLVPILSRIQAETLEAERTGQVNTPAGDTGVDAVAVPQDIGFIPVKEGIDFRLDKNVLPSAKALGEELGGNQLPITDAGSTQELGEELGRDPNSAHNYYRAFDVRTSGVMTDGQKTAVQKLLNLANDEDAIALGTGTSFILPRLNLKVVDERTSTQGTGPHLHLRFLTDAELDSILSKDLA